MNLINNNFCHGGTNVLQYGSLKTLELYNGSRAGINGLISSFVKLLQVEWIRGKDSGKISV